MLEQMIEVRAIKCRVGSGVCWMPKNSRVASLSPGPSRHGPGDRLTKTGYDEKGSALIAKTDFDQQEPVRC
jgi:hypothetical protein